MCVHAAHMCMCTSVILGVPSLLISCLISTVSVCPWSNSEPETPSEALRPHYLPKARGQRKKRCFVYSGEVTGIGVRFESGKGGKL